MTAVLLDACVLYPIGLRDTLLNVAEAGFYRPLWTEEILAETSRNIVENTPGLTIEHLDETFAAMRRAFPEAMVEGYENRVEEMTNDPKDRHVLAAAVVGGADILVTANLRHFPKSACSPHGILAQSPDEFLCDALSARPAVMVAVIRAQAARKLRPPTSVRDVGQRTAAVGIEPARDRRNRNRQDRSTRQRLPTHTTMARRLRTLTGRDGRRRTIR